MKIDVRTKGINATEDIKKYLNEKLRKLDRFTQRELQAKVMLKTEGKRVRVEITIPLGSFILRSEVDGEDLLLAIDKCYERLEAQLKGKKHKLVRSLQERNGINDLFVDTPVVEEMVNSAVKIKQYKLEILTFDEAVTQLELLGHSFFAYKNDKENVCIVYLRKDGEYGLIETF